MDPLPTWYRPRGCRTDHDDFHVHALTQRPMHMYHSWGTQNAWLRQITGKNATVPADGDLGRARLREGDYARVTSAHGSIIVPVAHQAEPQPAHDLDLERHRQAQGCLGARPDAPEATEGFLLNHLIHELQPPKGDGQRWANSDPSPVRPPGSTCGP